MTIEEAVSRVRPLDAAAMRAAEKRFSDIAMPLGGLGLLQDAIIQLAGIQRKPVPIIRPRAAVIFCADNGVVAGGDAVRAGCHGNSHPKHGTGKVHHVHDGEID